MNARTHEVTFRSLAPYLAPIETAPRGVMILIYSEQQSPLWTGPGQDYSCAIGARGTGSIDGVWVRGEAGFLAGFEVAGTGFRWTHWALIPPMFV